MLEKPETKEFEKIPFLTNVIAAKMKKAEVIEPTPHYADTEYGKKLVVTIKSGAKKYVWFMNNKSATKAISLLGQNEEKWIGKTIEIEVLDQVVSGKRKKVVYVKGAVE
jgi:hypothetical protein